MAQMAPALTEARASPSSSEKHFAEPSSVHLEGQSKQEDISKNLNNVKLTQNGFHKSLVNICNNRTSCDLNTPKASCLSQQQEGENSLNGFPNKERESVEEERVEKMVNGSASGSKCEIHSSALPRCTTTCAPASSRPAGTCETGCAKETDLRLFQPVADIELKETPLVKKKNVISKQQTKLEKRAKKLQRRLYKLEARQLDVHVRQQLGGLIDQQKQSSEVLTECGVGKERKASTGVDSVASPRPSSNQKVENDGESENKVKLESGHVVRSASTNSHASSYELKGSSVSSKNNARPTNFGENVFDTSFGRSKFENMGKQAQDVVGNLITQLELFESVGDSDATESSSGGESCDEDEGDRQKQRTKSSIATLNRYEQDRAGVAAKWSWLQAQIIDIDRKIKRYDTLYRNLRLTKGTVKLDGIRSDSLQTKTCVDDVGVPCVDKGGVDMTSLGQKLGELYQKSGHNHWCNGLRKPLSEGGPVPVGQEAIKRPRIGMDSSESANPCFDCARTRPIKLVKRRRLVQLSKLNLVDKKPPTVGCSCSSVWTPCILCRKSIHTAPVIDPDQLLQEKVALLDHSYHPILSSSSDIPLQLHFESLIRRGGFEARTKPSSPSKPSVQNKRQLQSHVNSNVKKIKLSKGAAASLLSSAKLRKTEKNNQKRNSPSSLPGTPKNNVKVDRLCKTEPRQKRAAAITAAQLQKRARSLSLPTTSPSSAPTTPPPQESQDAKLSQSMPPSNLSSLLRKKRPSTAFDINNIVIPYSMASTTRVEKLQYKEIITPQWRLYELQPISEKNKDNPELKEVMLQELEDISEDVFALRHALCEMKEKQRFLGLLTKKRKRSNRGGQGSELTTPEPLSPAAIDTSTPPGTPAPPLSTLFSSAPSTPVATPSPLCERQTSSGHTRSASTDSQCEEVFPVVAPWPARVFPLNEDELEALNENPETPLPSCPPSPNPSAVSSPVSWQSSPAQSPLASPLSTKGESWTVKVVTPEESDPDKPRKGIVLKLAKR